MASGRGAGFRSGGHLFQFISQNRVFERHVLSLKVETTRVRPSRLMYLPPQIFTCSLLVLSFERGRSTTVHRQLNSPISRMIVSHDSQFYAHQALCLFVCLCVRMTQTGSCTHVIFFFACIIRPCRLSRGSAFISTLLGNVALEHIFEYVFITKITAIRRQQVSNYA